MNFGILCSSGTGYLNSMSALVYELQQRGYRVTLFGLPELKSYAVATKLELYPIGAAKFSLGSTERSLERLDRLGSIPALL